MLFANLRGSLGPQLKPLAYSAFGLFFNGQATRSASSSTKYMLRKPSPSAPREVPRPLVILSAEQWDKDSKDGMQGFAAAYAERGYTTLEIDLAPPPSEDSLTSHVRLATIPFPPVIIARAGACIVAQSYIESNPAYALALIEPPLSNSSCVPKLLPTPTKEFTFEPRFPIAIISTSEKIKGHRIVREGEEGMVDILEAGDIKGSGALMEIEKWMDSIGV
ncbi:hypothetical protein AG1IA_02045 [Rhizoctonia solani AG-1 IA]|uniref:Uncharacterized protein n=1 Tax=Thanatephorus cucumeris (strain AG1-IA) TaxID=983506 RepID=L8X5L1_THACA|nr:hypothetical protein AG1IA_02045 [Rhizoctonia solani AG-1 IA]